MLADSDPMNIPVCIAVVEDDLDLRQSIEEFLTHTGYRVWGVGSAEAFFRQFVVDPPNVVLLDIGLPGEDGFTLAVIILSARDALEDRLKGLNAGADRYLVKPVDLTELTANINAVTQRLALAVSRPAMALPQPVLKPGSQQWQLNQQSWLLSAPNGLSIVLTAKEFALLHQLIRVQGQVVTKKELADEIFGSRIANAADRLNVLVTRLRKKFTAPVNLN